MINQMLRGAANAMNGGMTRQIGTGGGGGAGGGGAGGGQQIPGDDARRDQMVKGLAAQCQRGDEGACESLKRMGYNKFGGKGGAAGVGQKKDPLEGYSGGMGGSSSSRPSRTKVDGPLSGRERLRQKWSRRTTAPTATGATGGNPWG